MKPGEIRVQKGARPCPPVPVLSPRRSSAQGRRATHSVLRPSLTLPSRGRRDSHADIAELDAGRVGKVTFPVPDDVTSMELAVSPDQGLWKGATFKFSIKVPDMYPHEPPKVCEGVHEARRRAGSRGRGVLGRRALVPCSAVVGAPVALRAARGAHDARPLRVLWARLTTGGLCVPPAPSPLRTLVDVPIPALPP